MCLGMNEDQLSSKKDVHQLQIEILKVDKERQNSPFVSPGMAVAAALKGYLADVREIN